MNFSSLVFVVAACMSCASAFAAEAPRPFIACEGQPNVYEHSRLKIEFLGGLDGASVSARVLEKGRMLTWNTEPSATLECRRIPVSMQSISRPQLTYDCQTPDGARTRATFFYWTQFNNNQVTGTFDGIDLSKMACRVLE